MDNELTTTYWREEGKTTSRRVQGGKDMLGSTLLSTDE